jgi:hypothetical protein
LTIGLIFAGRKRPNGESNLQYLFSASGHKQVVRNTGINLNKEHWDKKKQSVVKTHPNALDLNRHIDKMVSKMRSATTKYDVDQLNFYEVIDFVTGSTDGSTVDAFVETYIKKDKTRVTYKQYKNFLSTFKRYAGIKGDMNFKDISYSTFARVDKIFKEKIRDGELSPRSCTNYMMNIRSIWSSAYKYKVVYDPIDSALLDFNYKSNKGQRGKAGNTKEEIDTAINNIKTIREWQACAYWLLGFGTRGLYSADFVRFDDKHLVSKKLKPNAKVGDDWFENNIYLDHVRSKSGADDEMPMLIKLFPEVLDLIEKIRYTTIYTYAGKECNKKDIIANISNRINLFDYDVKAYPEFHANHFKYRQNKFKDLEVPNIQIKKARKSFEQAVYLSKREDGSRKWTIDQANIATGRALGNKVKQESYLDFTDEELIDETDALHLDTLQNFKWFDLYKLLSAKLVEVVEAKELPKWILKRSLVIENKANKMLVGVGFTGNKLDYKNIEWVEVEAKFRKYFKDIATPETFTIKDKTDTSILFTKAKDVKDLTEDDYIKYTPSKTELVEFSKEWGSGKQKEKYKKYKELVQEFIKKEKKEADVIQINRTA